MKTEDLQRCDYVAINGAIRKVEQITKRKIGYHVIPDESRMHYARICEVEPVPITPEILEKNGFVEWRQCHDRGWEYNGFGTKYTNNEFDSISLRMIEYNNNHRWSVQFSIYGECSARIFIDYVHELQHAMKLCKIDKEIEL